MCLGCYAEAGFPKIINANTKRIVELAERVYEFCSSGGNLHCELDDYNLDDDFIDEFKPYDPNVNPVQLALERECYAALKAATEDERYAAVALRDGYLREDGTLAPEIDEAAWLAQIEEENSSA